MQSYRDDFFSWEQCKLGDVAEITAGGDINKGDLINKGKYPVIANGLNNNGIVGYSNKYKIDAPAVTITGRGTLGVATARFINFTPIVRLISIKSDLDPIYLENVINNTHFVIESTGVPQLTAPQVKRQTVILSNCHIEQTKIGSLLSTLDNAITLHEEKKRQLEHLKSALLQKMFADKSRYPAVRFEGFSDEWEQRKVKDIFKITRGQVLAATETSEEKSDISPFPVYSSQTKNNGLMGYYKDYLFDTAITWTTDGANAGTVSYRSGRFYSTNVNGVLISDKGYANKAISEILNLEAWKWVSHVGNPKLMNNVMGDISIMIPSSFEEQDRLSDFLNQLDDTIALHDQKLSLLKRVKQTLLQKMFI